MFLEIHYRVFGLTLCCLFIAFVTLTLRHTRRVFYEKSLLKGGRWKFYEKYLHQIYLCRFIFMFFFPSAVVILFFGVEVTSKQFLNLLVMGLALVTFASIEHPLLTKPNVFITMLPTEKKSYREEHEFSICVRAGEEKLLMFRVVNLGFHTIKNCTAIFYFHDGSKPLEDPRLYNQVDFKKIFSIQRKNKGILFSPLNNFISIPPQEVVVFPVWIKASDAKGKGDVEVQIYSESTWGMSSIKIPIRVI